MISTNLVLATTTSQTIAVTITEQLCQKYCSNASIQPNVIVEYSIDSTELVGTIEYVTVKANGTVMYVPKDGCVCNPKMKVFTEYFSIAFTGVTTASTPTITENDGIVSPANVNCCNVASGISYTNVVTITM